MRSLLTLTFALAACGAPSAIPPTPCEPACAAGQSCIAGRCFVEVSDAALDVAVDLAPQPDAVADATQPDMAASPDVAPLDAATLDAGPEVGTDAIAVADARRDVVSEEAGYVSCGPQRAYCEPVTDPHNCILLGPGVRRPDGTTIHCGACGVVCQVGETCAFGVCGR